uniref:non-specific serine/threonine protein kinase n=1 Tax=Varanus komodoensis TaxID=61221 RepID=A0A8D2J0V6_VARKO
MAGWAPPQLEDFILTERLGSGTYATVFKAYRKKNAREVVAIKCVSKKNLNKASVENLLTEIEILKTVRHPHIVELKDFQGPDSAYGNLQCSPSLRGLVFHSAGQHC